MLIYIVEFEINICNINYNKDWVNKFKKELKSEI